MTISPTLIRFRKRRLSAMAWAILGLAAFDLAILAVIAWEILQ